MKNMSGTKEIISTMKVVCKALDAFFELNEKVKNLKVKYKALYWGVNNNFATHADVCELVMF